MPPVTRPAVFAGTAPHQRSGRLYAGEFGALLLGPLVLRPLMERRIDPVAE